MSGNIQVIASTQIAGGGGGTVVYDAETDGSYSGNGSTTLALTTSGSDRYLTVGTVGGRAPAAVPTYNGVNMSLLGSESLTLVTMELRVYGLVAPASGANNIGFDFSGGAPNEFLLFAASFNDVNQSSPIGSVVTDSIDTQTQEFITAPQSLTVGQGAYAVMMTYNRTMSVDTLTLLGQQNPSSALSGAHGYRIAAGTESESCEFYWTGNQICANISVPILPA